MLKKILFAMVPMMLLASVTFANDDLLGGLDVDSISDADISIVEAAADLDFDAINGEAGEEDEAIEACFRRFGYCSYGGYGYGGYGCYGGYGYGYGCYNYNYCYSPCYTTYYSPVVYHTCYPVVRSYWGCW